MGKIAVYISFLIMIMCFIISNVKINQNIQKFGINTKKIVRYGQDVEIGDILYIDDRKEKVVQIFEDGSYLTQIVK